MPVQNIRIEPEDISWEVIKRVGYVEEVYPDGYYIEVGGGKGQPTHGGWVSGVEWKGTINAFDYIKDKYYDWDIKRITLIRIGVYGWFEQSWALLASENKVEVNVAGKVVTINVSTGGKTGMWIENTENVRIDITESSGDVIILRRIWASTPSGWARLGQKGLFLTFRVEYEGTPRYGYLIIRVVDSNGNPLQGALVEVTDPSMGVVGVKKTDRYGEAQFKLLEGNYEVRVSMLGYRTVVTNVKCPGTYRIVLAKTPLLPPVPPTVYYAIGAVAAIGGAYLAWKAGLFEALTKEIRKRVLRR